MKIGILGLGLIGGSFAKATKAATSHVIYGADKNRETLRRALAEGTVDGILDETTLGECDLLLLAVRPGAAVDYALQCTKFPPFVVDLCGVKRVVSEKLLPLSAERGFRYIGGHPMAGKEVAVRNSSANLFEGASMILVPHGGDIPLPLKEYFAALGFQTRRSATTKSTIGSSLSLPNWLTWFPTLSVKSKTRRNTSVIRRTV